MSSQYSIAVNKALESYGASTHGSLERRVERLKRFTDLKNKRYAEEIRLEEARQENRELEQEVEIPVYHETKWRVITGNQYNLRSRQQGGLNLLLRAIENGHVNTKRG